MIPLFAFFAGVTLGALAQAWLLHARISELSARVTAQARALDAVISSSGHIIEHLNAREAAARAVVRAPKKEWHS